MNDRIAQFREGWKELVADNPMLIEVTRFRRRFFEAGRGKTGNTALLVLAIVFYAGLLLLLTNFAGDIPPVALVYVQTVVFMILVPSMMYASIAGEREKRTWDLLLVAPVTQPQIVMGKLIAGVAGLMAAFVAFLLPTLFAAFTYRSWSSPAADRNAEMSPWMGLFLQEVISIFFAIFLVSAVLFFSARCKRSLIALAITIAALFVGLVVLPTLIGTATYGSGPADIMLVFHPIVAIAKINQLTEGSYYNSYGSDNLGQAWYGFPQVFLYSLFTAVFCIWSFKTLNWADGDVKFIPRKNIART